MMLPPQHVRRQWKILCGFALVLGAPTVTAAPLATGADLVTACRDEQSPGPCMNYLLNVADGYDTFAKWGAVPRQWCMPPGISHNGLRRTYLEYAARHVEVLKLPTNEALGVAFTRSFPCPEELPEQGPSDGR